MQVDKLALNVHHPPHLSLTHSAKLSDCLLPPAVPSLPGGPVTFLQAISEGEVTLSATLLHYALPPPPPSSSPPPFAAHPAELVAEQVVRICPPVTVRVAGSGASAASVHLPWFGGSALEQTVMLEAAGGEGGKEAAYEGRCLYKLVSFVKYVS